MIACSHCGWEIHLGPSVQRAELPCPKCGTAIKTGVISFQLGDQIERLLWFPGRWYKAAYRRLFKRECGCKKRQAWLNRFGERIALVFKRK